MANKKIAVVSPSQLEQVQETFIRAHAAYIPNTEFLCGGRIPYYGENGKKVVRFTLLSRIEYKLVNKLIHQSSLTYQEYEAYRYLKKNKFDAVLAEYGDTGGELLKIVKKLGIELYVHFHGADISMKHILEEYEAKYVEMFKYARNIFSVSDEMTERMISLGCSEEKIIKNVYGPNDKYYDVNVDYSTDNVVALGGFVDQKAPYFTIMAFQKVLQEVPKAKLIFGGSGALYNTCVFMAEYLGIKDNVDFVGFVLPKDVPDLLGQGSIFIQHSVTALKGDTEGTPVAIMEAMGAGLPIVSTIHAGIPGVVINDFNGYVVEEKDVDTMASHIITLLKDKEKKKTLGLNARKFVQENYTMKSHIDRIVKAIQA